MLLTDRHRAIFDEGPTRAIESSQVQHRAGWEWFRTLAAREAPRRRRERCEEARLADRRSRSIVILVLAVGFAALLSTATLEDVRAQGSIEQRIALIIGNSDYDQSLGQLGNPENDAKLISNVLKNVGFQVTAVLDSDQRAMKRAISDFSATVSAAGPDTVALFYYAGHGIQFNGANFLVPVGARIERLGDLNLEAIEAGAVLQQLEYAGAAVSIVVLDACRNNPLPRSIRSNERGLARMAAHVGSFVAYSTAPGGVAVDGEGANSPFAAALAEEIRRPGAAIEEVFRNVRRRVIEVTNEKQVPWDSSSLTDPFVFVPAMTGDQLSPKALSPGQAAEGTYVDHLVQAEAVIWELIMQNGTAAALEAFLRLFPMGGFTILARKQLEAINESAGTNLAPEPSATPVPPAKRVIAAEVELVDL